MTIALMSLEETRQFEAEFLTQHSKKRKYDWDNMKVGQGFKIAKFKNFIEQFPSPILEYYKEYKDTDPSQIKITPKAFQVRNVFIASLKRMEGVSEEFIKRVEQDDAFANDYFAPRIIAIAKQNFPSSEGKVDEIIRSKADLIGSFKPELFTIDNFSKSDSEFKEIKLGSFLSGSPSVSRDVVGRGGAGAETKIISDEISESTNIMSSKIQEAIQKFEGVKDRLDMEKAVIFMDSVRAEITPEQQKQLKEMLSKLGDAEQKAGAKLGEGGAESKQSTPKEKPIEGGGAESPKEKPVEGTQIEEKGSLDRTEKDESQATGTTTPVVGGADRTPLKGGENKNHRRDFQFVDSTGKTRTTGENYPTVFKDRRGHFNSMTERERIYPLLTRFNGTSTNPEGKLRKYAFDLQQLRSDTQLFKRVSANMRFTT